MQFIVVSQDCCARRPEKVIHGHFQACWHHQIHKLIIAVFSCDYIEWFVSSSVALSAYTVSTAYLRQLEDIENGNSDKVETWEPYVFALLLFLVLSVKTVTENQYFHYAVRMGMRARMAIITAVYRKALRLSPVARQELPVGSIVRCLETMLCWWHTMLTFCFVCAGELNAA